MHARVLRLPEPDEYKRVKQFKVGQDGALLIVTEYLVKRAGREIQTRVTLRTLPAFGQPPTAP